MNFWAKRTVTLHFSEAGKKTFGAIFKASSLEVSIEWADELGLWIFREQVDEATATVMLVRWEHFDTAVLDVIYEEPKQARVLGFRR